MVSSLPQLPMILTELPYDIILLICINLEPKGFLAFIQTCRVLHAFASSDYVWHHISHNLPLDIRSGELAHIPGPVIKQSVIRALQLSRNWERKVSTIRRITRIHSRNTVIHMQPLDNRWLVTLSRSPASSIHLSVWRLEEAAGASVTPTCIALFEPLHAFKFAASLQDDGDSVLISVLGASPTHKGRLLTVYHLNLKGRIESGSQNGTPYLMNNWVVENPGVFYYSEIAGPIVAAAVVHVSQAAHSHQIVVLNTRTNVTVLIDSPSLSKFDCGRLQFRIYSEFIALVGVYNEQLKVQVRELPMNILSGEPISHLSPTDLIPVEDWKSSVVDYDTPRDRNLEIYTTAEPLYQTSLESISVMVAHSPFSTMQRGKVNVFHFPVDTSKRDQRFSNWEPDYTFTTPPNVTLEPTCLGKTGRRAVWLEHQWNTDDFRLMKGSFIPTGDAPPHAVLLRPAEMALPFEPHTCRSLAFEESSGRVWIGVHTGDIYILEF
ncbi:unnamed protein product [Cyclocybe aegerita]|uniref:F-box domain-containing protein n=1 Tax=Cyclocybe aegerita TaxID=1973307 RepID=A0A8S0WVL1_CYCAE|nr:unnamed protein product [Cyclocybe aegerita]